MSADPRVEAAARAIKGCIENQEGLVWANPKQSFWDNEAGGLHTGVEGLIECNSIATAALAAIDAASIVTTVEELDALPVGSVVLAHWENGSQPDYHAMKCRDGGASSSGFAVTSGKHWTGMASWGATLTVLHRGTE